MMKEFSECTSRRIVKENFGEDRKINLQCLHVVPCSVTNKEINGLGCAVDYSLAVLKEDCPDKLEKEEEQSCSSDDVALEIIIANQHFISTTCIASQLLRGSDPSRPLSATAESTPLYCSRKIHFSTDDESRLRLFLRLLRKPVAKNFLHVDIEFTENGPLPIDITKELTAIISDNHIESFQISGDILVHPTKQFWESLKNNTILKSVVVTNPFSWTWMQQPHSLAPLEYILEQSNIALHKFLIPDHQSTPKVDYLLRLNQWGRASARQLDNGKTATGAVVSIGTLLGDVQEISQLNRLNVFYGLLKESPGLWIASVLS